MIKNCEEIKELLGAWLDGEIDAARAAAIQLHVRGCASCLNEKARLERLESLLKSVLETNASEVAFDAFWAGVRQRVADEKSWRTRAVDWLRGVFSPPRLAWAVPAMVVILVTALSLDQFFPGWRWVFGPTNVASVESIDGHGFNVALLREAKTKTTVIWLFENQENDDETSVEPVSGNASF
jgi:predicted anti-sigma-YlaC factor YlaD